ncbi:MAG TPA: hypothetical protein VGM73_17445 [Candidatus Didemnitutus sp.]|jgi:hypothetical protein
MNSKILIALLGFAGLTTLGRAAVWHEDAPYRREVVTRSYCPPVCGRIVYVQREPFRPRVGHYERYTFFRNDGCREIRWRYCPGAWGRR